VKNSELKYEKKLLLDVVEQMENSEVTARKQQVLGRVIFALAYLGLLIAFGMTLNELSHPFTTAFLAACSGCALGFALFHQFAQKQWPVTRKHIDMQSVQKRLDELGG